MVGGDEEDRERREGRGRLSSIDMLPEEAEPDIVWALEQLRGRSMPSKMILAEFNSRLADRGIGPVSKSSWGRYSVRKAIKFRKLDEEHRLARELLGTLGTDGPDALTIMAAETIKLAAMQILDGGEVGAKALNEVSGALRNAVNAQKGSAEHRRQLEREVDERLRKAAEAVEEVGAQAGVGPDTLRKITNLLTTGSA